MINSIELFTEPFVSLFLHTHARTAHIRHTDLECNRESCYKDLYEIQWNEDHSIEEK